MEPYLVWMLIGFALVIVELLSGTFYLLMLGIAAFGGAAVAYLGHGFEAQIILAAVIAAAGCYGVHVYRAKNSKEQMKSVDAGQPANFENWVDEGGGLARVRYRGASWDAHIEGAGVLEEGALLYVEGLEGHTLKVSRRRPL
jgi:membrane protein implicated in regulation of membrane protease activity